MIWVQITVTGSSHLWAWAPVFPGVFKWPPGKPYLRHQPICWLCNRLSPDTHSWRPSYSPR